MKFIHAIATISFICIFFPLRMNGAIPDVPEDKADVENWKKKRQESIESLLSQPDSVKIYELGTMLKQLKTLNYRECEEKSEIIKQITKEIILIPNHTKYFIDKMDEARKANEEFIQKSIKFDPGWEKLPDESEIFQTNAYKFAYMWQAYSGSIAQNVGMLAHIPSTECVRVLGEYLHEIQVTNDTYQAPTRDFSAARSLSLLIADGPIQKWTASATEVPMWRKWYDEVKAGKRTFRFKGDDTEYDLNGPVTKRKLEQIQREKIRDSERSDGKSKTGDTAVEKKFKNSEKQTKPSVIAALITSIVLVVVALWYLVRSRATRA